MSVSQSVHQSAILSVSQPGSQPVIQSTTLSVSQPSSLSISQSVNQPASQAANQTPCLPVSQSVSQPVSHMVSQPYSQPPCLSVSQSVSQSSNQPPVCQSACCLQFWTQHNTTQTMYAQFHLFTASKTQRSPSGRQKISSTQTCMKQPSERTRLHTYTSVNKRKQQQQQNQQNSAPAYFSLRSASTRSPKAWERRTWPPR